MNKIFVIFIVTFLHCEALRPSKGCGKPPPELPFPGEAFKFIDIYNDKILGPTERNYIVYIPQSYNPDETNMLVIDMHGLHGSADGQSEGWWRKTAARKNDFIVVWLVCMIVPMVLVLGTVQPLRVLWVTPVSLIEQIGKSLNVTILVQLVMKITHVIGHLVQMTLVL